MVHATGHDGLSSLPRDQTSMSEKFRQRRLQSKNMTLGISAVSNSAMFKEPSLTLPAARDMTHHFSSENLSRPPCILKQAASFLKTPGLISLGGGLPSSEYFPISEMSMRVPIPPHFGETQTLSSQDDVSQAIRFGKYDASQGISDYDMSIAFNYGQAMGNPQMIRFVTEHTEMVCQPQYKDWECCQTVGSTAALEQTARMLCDRTRNDAVVTEEYTFATAVETFAPQGIPMFGVKMDEQGLLPNLLDDMLSSWNRDARGARKPHVLYTVPTGQNPTGATQSLQRRKDIYRVCQKHDVFIIEDEPYYFLQMSCKTSKLTTEDHCKFLNSLIPSYLSLDVDGRVLRMDSFSKVLLPGSRLGWVTGSEQVIQRYIRHAEVANQGPSGISQLVVWKLLDETWGHEGYLRWLADLRGHYTRRRDSLLSSCQKRLPTEVVSWTVPEAGMFLWLKLDHTKHPHYTERSLLAIEEEIFLQAIDNGVLFARGSWFRAEPDKPLQDLFVRVTYASASEEAMDEAIQRLGAAINKSFGIM